MDATLELVQSAPARFPEKHREPDFGIRRALVEGFPYGVFFVWDEGADATSVIALYARPTRSATLAPARMMQEGCA